MAVTQQPPANYNSVRSWLAVFGASLALFCTVGFLNAFGVFQEYYTAYLHGYSDTAISWIGSISIFLLYLGGPLSGVLLDKIGPTILLGAGSLGLLVSIFMTSLCTQYYQLILAQALLLGMSMSLIFAPSVAVVSRRMPHRRGLAIGLAIGGSSIGGVIWPIVLDRLLYADGVSFGWVLRIVGFIMLPLLIITLLTVIDAQVPPSQVDSEGGRSDSSEEKPKKKADFSVLRNPTFVLLCLGLAMVYFGLFTPFFYVSSYAIERGSSSSTAFYLISVINASSFFGRVIPGYLADRYGHFNLCTLSVLVASIIGFCWTAAFNLPGLIIWCIAYGFASGAVMSLQGACAGKVAPASSQGTAVGLVTGSVSITALVGTPISGKILETGYLGLGMWTGSTLLAGALILCLARLRLDRTILAVH